MNSYGGPAPRVNGSLALDLHRMNRILEVNNAYAYAVVEASAELTPVAAEPDDATVGELVEYYRALSGEHPDWDDYRRAMVTDRRLIVRLRPERAYGMLPA